MNTIKFEQVGSSQMRPLLGFVAPLCHTNKAITRLGFYTTELCYSFVNAYSVLAYTNHFVLPPLFKAIPHDTKIPLGSGKKKHQRDLFIRQFSEKRRNLHFSPKVVTLSGFQFFRQNNGTADTLLYFSKRVSAVNKQSARWLPNKSSIFSFDLKFNQLLFAHNRFYRLNSNRKLGYLYATNLDKMGFLSSDLSNLGLSLKTYTLLKQKGVHKIGSLVACSPKALSSLLNKNREMFAEVKRCFVLVAICENI